MKKTDPWTVLGVTRDSPPASWKRAYRRLAMRWHPDRNDDPAATERFKEIAAAYEALLAVDRPAVEEITPEPEPEPAEKPAAPVKAADIRINLELPLVEAAIGCRKTIHFHRNHACAKCAGSGEAGVQRTRFCGACHGSGRVRDAARALVSCPECSGRGFFSERICPACAGSGHHSEDVSLLVTIPPGMLPGDDLRLAGQGEAASAGGLPGDLYLTMVIQAHPLFELQGSDVHLTMPVSALALMAGADIEIPALFGPVLYTLNAGSPTPRQCRLPGHGYPGRGRRARGDLIVALQPIFPAELGEQQRQALLQAHAALLDDVARALPELAAWQAVLKP